MAVGAIGKLKNKANRYGFDIKKTCIMKCRKVECYCIVDRKIGLEYSKYFDKDEISRMHDELKGLIRQRLKGKLPGADYKKLVRSIERKNELAGLIQERLYREIAECEGIQGEKKMVEGFFKKILVEEDMTDIIGLGSIDRFYMEHGDIIEEVAEPTGSDVKGLIKETIKTEAKKIYEEIRNMEEKERVSF